MYTGSQLTHVSYEFCKENVIYSEPINQIFDIEGTGGVSIYYLEYI